LNSRPRKKRRRKQRKESESERERAKRLFPHRCLSSFDTLVGPLLFLSSLSLTPLLFFPSTYSLPPPLPPPSPSSPVEYSPFYGIEKGAALQDARCFNDAHVDARRCQQVITKLLYLLVQGETFTKKESSEVFFSVTKLFQARDPALRRMVYLVIKDVCPGPDEVIIITSSLMKDMNSPVDLYRANAIRVLASIADAGLLAQIERYLKQAVVDKAPAVASAVLVSAAHLLAPPAGSTAAAAAAAAGGGSSSSSVGGDVVRRWAPEIGEAAQSRHPMVQFHALALSHALRAGDRLAVAKLVSSLVRAGGPRSPLAQVLLVRFAAQVIAEAGAPSSSSSSNEPRPYFEFLEGCMRNRAEMVVVEAARAVARMPGVTARELAPAVAVLQIYLRSSRPVLRFAAVRTLAAVAAGAHPQAVTPANADLEALVSDANRSVATLAIATLLKTGSESGVERLLGHVGSLMGDIGDEFRVVLVAAIRALCLKFPSKHRALMGFLASALREDGGLEYKRAIVDAIVSLVRAIPDAREPGLGHLCEFIEDCEFTSLSTAVLHLLGAEGPATRDPERYVRHIYNRVILENAAVRAAAVSSLAAFARSLPRLRPRVAVILRRALADGDDEVRDRAALALDELDAAGGEAEAAAKGEEATTEGGEPTTPPPLLPRAVGPRALEAALTAYLDGDASVPFDLDSVPADAPPPQPAADDASLLSSSGAGGGGGGGGVGGGSSSYSASASAGGVHPAAAAAAAALAAVPALAHLGAPSASTPPLRLTEEETEYSVALTKHLFGTSSSNNLKIVLAFECANTVAEQLLERAVVDVEVAGSAWLVEATVAIPSLPHGKPGTSYVVLARNPECANDEETSNSIVPSALFPATLRFAVKEIDPSTGEAEPGDGYDDEYALEAVPLGPGDALKGLPLVADFTRSWDEFGEAGEVVDEYGLGERERGVEGAVEAVAAALSPLAVASGSDAVPPHARSHALLLCGSVAGAGDVLVRAAFGATQDGNVMLKLAARGKGGSTAAAEAVHAVIQEG